MNTTKQDNFTVVLSACFSSPKLRRPVCAHRHHRGADGPIAPPSVGGGDARKIVPSTRKMSTAAGSARKSRSAMRQRPQPGQLVDHGRDERDQARTNAATTIVSSSGTESRRLPFHQVSLMAP